MVVVMEREHEEIRDEDLFRCMVCEAWAQESVTRDGGTGTPADPRAGDCRPLCGTCRGASPEVVLGVHSHASAEEIAKAFRSRVREFHPDVCGRPDAQACFMLLQMARDDLLDGPAPQQARPASAGPQDLRDEFADFLPPHMRGRHLGDEELGRVSTDDSFSAIFRDLVEETEEKLGRAREAMRRWR